VDGLTCARKQNRKRPVFRTTAGRDRERAVIIQAGIADLEEEAFGKART
jgi:hypothetical protein